MEGTIEHTSLPNKIPGCTTVLRHIEIAPCYDSSHKNALCCSSVASPKIFCGVNIVKLGSNSIWFWDSASGSTKPQDKPDIFWGDGLFGPPTQAYALLAATARSITIIYLID